jgi:hypothetical protein
MSDLPMQQIDHPAYNLPLATQDHQGRTLIPSAVGIYMSAFDLAKAAVTPKPKDDSND